MSGPQVTPRFKEPKAAKKKAWWSTVAHKSAKRISQKELRDRICELALRRAGYRCEAVELVPHITCDGRLDVHEVIPRSAWPGGHLVLSNTKALCRAHHTWVGEHQEAAHDLGLHGWSWERPAKTQESDRWAS